VGGVVVWYGVGGDVVWYGVGGDVVWYGVGGDVVWVVFLLLLYNDSCTQSIFF